MTTGGRIAVGFLLAFIAQFLAFMLAGAGHGWVAPFLISILLWGLLPTTLAIAWPIGRSSRQALSAILVAALAADAWLINRSIGEARYISHYADVNGVVGWMIVGLWLGLWTFWQAILVWSLVARRQQADDANG